MAGRVLHAAGDFERVTRIGGERGEGRSAGVNGAHVWRYRIEGADLPQEAGILDLAGIKESVAAANRVLAGLNRRSFGHDGVQMIRSCDDDTVDVLLLVQHLAEIGVARGLVEFLFESDAFGPVALLIVLELFGDLALRKSEIDVREGDEILRLGQLQSVLGSHATKADYREVHGVAGRLVSDAAKHVSRNDHHSNSNLSGIGNELAARDLLTRHEKQPPV